MGVRCQRQSTSIHAICCVYGNTCICRQEARTVFTDPLYRPARIDHFAVHSVPVDGSMYGHCFAVASWPQRHPDINFWGKPYQIWCRSLFECSLSNFVENISSVLLTADFFLEEEHVLLVVPLIS